MIRILAAQLSVRLSALLLLAALLLTAPALHAQGLTSGMSNPIQTPLVIFTDPVFGTYYQDLDFDGYAFNPGADPVYLNTYDFSFDPNSPLFGSLYNLESTVLPGDYSAIQFQVGVLDPFVVPGSYSGTMNWYGGATPQEGGLLLRLPFTVNIPRAAPVPEASPLLSLSLLLLLFPAAALTRQRQRRQPQRRQPQR